MKSALLLLLCSVLVCAQVNVGSVSGSVIDPSGAAVANARAQLVNQGTGVTLNATTTSTGQYLFLPVQAGRYTLTVEAAGFKKIERRDLLLQVGEKLGVDVSLEVGQVSDVVNVTAESPLLTTTNANVGQVIDNRKIMELPLPGRETIRLVQLAPGVGGLNSNLGDLRFGGGRTRAAEFFVDGSPTSAAGDARATALPPIDAIQEFKVETNNLSAEYGRLSGGAINIQTRSGTNEYHGSLYDFVRDASLNANSWDGNRRGSPRGDFSLHQFGGTIGGPVSIPKLYNGRNKTFFFFNYDAERRNNAGSLRFTTVPTELERRGDFSETVNNNGQRVTIFDPATFNPATNARSPFPGNRIPESRWDPAARFMTALWPLPNRPGDPRDLRNNFAGVNASDFGRNDFTLRVDQNFGSNHRIYLRLTRNSSKDVPAYWAGPATEQTRHTWTKESSSTVNYTGTLTPSWIVSAQAGAAPRDFTYFPVFEGFEPTQVPFSPNARRELDPRFVPNMQFERVSNLGVNFLTTWLRERYFFGNVSATRVFSRHTLKMGYEMRPIYLNNTEPGAPSGRATFDGAWTGLNQQAPFAQQGNGFASFLLGAPNSFSFDSGQLGWAVGYRNHGAFIQDDWRVNQKLTLNLGLRWEYEAPMTDRFDRMAIIDHEADSGIRANRNWNWERDVIGTGQLPAGVPAPQINLGGPFLGGVGQVRTQRFPGRGGTRQVFNNFGPRVGLAYQLTPTTVLRSGFGILYAGFTGNASGSNSLSLQNFFRTTGNALVTTDNGQTLNATLSNPFPGNIGLIPGTNDPELVTRLYQGSNAFAYQWDQRPGMEISYNFGLQRQVGKWVFEGSFIGNRGLHLTQANPIVNAMDTRFLALGTSLERNVANPFFGAGNQENGNLLTRATIPYKVLLRPQAHLTGDQRMLQRSNGQSLYLAGFFRAERRFSKGLSVLLSYTVSKLMENTPSRTGGAVYTLPQDGRSFDDIRALSVQDQPQKLVATYMYELPFFKANRWIGGWQVSGFTTIARGYPLSITQNDNYTANMGLGRLRPTLVNSNILTGASVEEAKGLPGQASARFLNPAAFAVTQRYGMGTVPAVLPNVRQPWFNVTDLALMKNFRVRERMNVQLRVEAQNAFNTPIFNLGGNDLNIQSATFGYFNSVISQPRNVQIGGRFVF